MKERKYLVCTKCKALVEDGLEATSRYDGSILCTDCGIKEAFGSEVRLL